MKIIIDKELVKGDYVIEFRAENLPDEEFDLAVSKFNYPKVEFGGIYTEEVIIGGNPEIKEVLKFNHNLRDLTKDLPYTRIFKESKYGENAEKYANIYANELEIRISNALDELRSRVDNFSDDDIEIYY